MDLSGKPGCLGLRVWWSVFFIELDFFIVHFFYIVKKKSFGKKFVIKLYKVHVPIHIFDWLTWLMGLTSLTFLN